MNERIRLIREGLNLSRAAFGDKLGISGDVVNNLERGRIEIKDERIKLICSTFDINEEWLRTGNGDPTLQRTQNQVVTDFLAEIIKENDESFKKRVIEILARLDSDDWEFLARLTEKVAKK